ncbi:MAG: 23S rRNA (guanosine(2251)-2'-O)-methyltransferase RlmB [Alphaproteobacteria bacterium]
MKKNKFNKKPQATTKHNHLWLYGKHAVMTAIENERRKIFRILTSGESFPQKILETIKNRNIVIENVPKSEIDSLLTSDAVHQGVAAEVAFLDNYPLEDLCSDSGSKLIVILDQVTDPHNIGAIMRSAAAFNADAVIVPDKNTCQETGVLAKSASGALDTVPFIRVANLANAMDTLKKNDFWIIGLDGKCDKELSQIDITAKTAIVLGSEGDGIRRLILENCDFVAKLPISEKIESLNVSNAAAVALYEIASKRKSFE